MPFMIESNNIRDQFIRHQNFEGELNALDSGFREDFLFEVIEGERPFVQESSPETVIKPTVRFKSVNFPNRFLRHRAFRLLLEEPAPGGESLFEDDSTFFAEVALIGGPAAPISENWRSFRCVNFADRFIRHRDLHLFADVVRGQDELARKDATFRLVPQ